MNLTDFNVRECELKLLLLSISLTDECKDRFMKRSFSAINNIIHAIDSSSHVNLVKSLNNIRHPRLEFSIIVSPCVLILSSS